MVNSKPTAIDLFAGAGGLSLGFERAGFMVPYAVEIDDWASDTYEKNRTDSTVIRRDIVKLPDGFFEKFKGTDVVMGGPPCQGFSIAASNRRKPDDKRNYLYREFLRAVKIVQPRIVFIENVKELTKFKLPSGELILDEIYETLGDMGYSAKHYLLNAADFGVPQNRMRFFMIGIKSGLPITFHSQTDRQITLWDAISDLPEVYPRKHKEDDAFQYAKEPQNQYQRMMREGSNLVYNHIPMRHTEMTVERFKHISGGSEEIPVEFLPRKRGNTKIKSDKVYSQNHRKLDPNSPSPTITASFYSSFIHPYQHRNLTVREAARLQSFPDVYRFYGKRTTLSKKLLARKEIKEDLHLDQFNQVGNAVPPLLAQKLAEKLIKLIRSMN